MSRILILLALLFTVPAFADTTDSSGNRKLNGVVNIPKGFYGNTPTVLTGTISIGTSGIGNAVGPTSYTTQLSDSAYFTSQSTAGTGSSATVTITLSRAGYYRVEVLSDSSSSGTGPTACINRHIYGGTATLVSPVAGNNTFTTDMSNPDAQDCTQQSFAIYSVVSPTKTITVNPWCAETFTAGTHSCSVSIAVFPL